MMKNKSLFLLLFAILFTFASNVSAQEKISILGDSYSTFHGYLTPDSNSCWYGVPEVKRENDVKRVEDTWWYHFISNHGFILELNNSYSGATICNTGYKKNDYSDRSFITRMSHLGNPDIVLVFGGTNDSWAGSPIGKYIYNGWTQAELYNFRPAFSYLLDHLIKNYPNAKIYNITNSELSAEVTESMDEICRHYDIVNIRLNQINKQSGHPSIQGMKSISDQVWEVIGKK